METDPEFKKEVLDENNYLKYCNEINYYTGLHRGEAEILKNVVDIPFAVMVGLEDLLASILII